MRTATTILTILFLLVAFCSHGQARKKKNYFPLWTFHQDSVNIHGVSLGLWSFNRKPRHTNTNGIKLELIGVGMGVPLIPSSPIVEDDTSFINMQKEPLSERINGLVISGTGTVCQCLTNGFTAGFIGQINFQVNGAAASLVMNFSQKHNGIMIASFNEAYYMTGLQIGVSNYGRKMKGIQVSLLGNGSLEMKGIQIGLFNKAEKLKGIQLGLWNVNGKRKLPLINWNFRRQST